MFIFLYFGIAVLLIVVDQLTKWAFFGKSFSLIGDFLWIEGKSLNTGAAGGIFSGQMWLFISLAIIVSAAIIYLLLTKKYSNSKFFKITLSVMLAGILGNFIDRIMFNGVRDFIYFKSINFYIFNFADIYLTIGAILLCVYMIFLHKDKVNNEEKIKSQEKDNNE